MKAGDLACYLTHNFAPVLLLRRGINSDWDRWDTWIVMLDGKEVEAWSENLVLWDDRKDEKVP
jgi:hypothetical protein|tara:strand:- start:56 stop:244 length:189 start_codon:yes stop_codon:yes gene_type:complete